MVMAASREESLCFRVMGAKDANASKQGLRRDQISFMDVA